MSRLKRLIGAIGERAEKKFESRRLRPLTDGSDALLIHTFRTFGTTNLLHVMGRTLIDRRISPGTEEAPVWRNVLDAYKRMHSRELPGAQLMLRFGSVEQPATSDDEGYFAVSISLAEPIVAADEWVSVEVHMLAPRRSESPAKALVLIPQDDAEFGIISDLDDTVIKTGATALVTMVKSVTLENARTREPFEGVAGFYHALRRGRTGSARNPIFYVSSGPWNLYDLYSDFLDHRGVPPGPIMLADFGVDEKKLIHSSHSEHKLGAIRRVFETYVDLSFILIGDSGQEDPEIYREVVREFPKRVLAIYIRDVTIPERNRVILEISGQLQLEGVEMILAENTKVAARHAADRGFITSGNF